MDRVKYCISCYRYSASVNEVDLCKNCRENLPPSLHFKREGKGLVPLTASDAILLKERWFEVKREVDKFFHYVSNEEIDLHNHQIKTRNSPNGDIASKESGYVYVLRSASNHYKIGRARDVEKRVKGIQTSSPIKIDLIHYFSCKDAGKVERYLHRLFDDARIQGEWFVLDKDQVSWLISLNEKSANFLI